MLGEAVFLPSADRGREDTKWPKDGCSRAGGWLGETRSSGSGREKERVFHRDKWGGE